MKHSNSLFAICNSTLLHTHSEFARIVFHGLRHSSATYQLMISGGDVKTVQRPCKWRTKRKSHEESCDSSWDFGALEGTRIPGPLIKSQMLYRLSYERIQYLYNIRNIAI